MPSDVLGLVSYHPVRLQKVALIPLKKNPTCIRRLTASLHRSWKFSLIRMYNNIFWSFFLKLCILHISFSQLNFQSPGNWFRELYRWKNTLNTSKSNIQMCFPFYWIYATYHTLSEVGDRDRCCLLWRSTWLTLSFTTQLTRLPVVRCVYTVWGVVMHHTHPISAHVTAALCSS